MAKRRTSGKHASKSYKSFSEMKGSKHPIAASVGGDKLGHDAQLPINPNMGDQNPLLNPGQSGHPMGDPGRIGMAMGNDPSGSEYY